VLLRIPQELVGWRISMKMPVIRLDRNH
ncbi:uncharacterized protein METZ01_LOCUS497693, partial [marine metagenome]